MVTIDNASFQKVIRVVKAGVTDIAYEPALKIAFKWLYEHENGLLSLTAEQEKTLKEELSF